MDVKRILKNLDWWLVTAVVLLLGCGLGLIDSATHSFAVSTGKAWHVQRQSMFMAFGLLLVTASFAFDYRMLKNYASRLYIFNIVLLVAVMLFGHSQLGAQRWIQIGSLSFQPSEFAKVFLIICLATFMDKRIEWLENFKDYLPVFAYIFVPFVLVMRQPDLGTSLTFIAILVGMIFVSGFKYKWFFRLGVLFVALLPVFWLILKDYQKNRIRVFLNPELDPFGSGYHVIQSKIAIGSGGLFGKGWLAGTQSQLNFLPENHTDFIFAVAGEEFGFIGTAFIIILYAIIIWRGIAIALDADDNFGTLLAVGVTSMFMFHVMVNIGMTAGIMPVTGVPLPFLSYGVSSLTTNLMLVALLLNIKVRKQNLQF
ncbi:MAG: rod shape-determining protein RodA [Phascolarctobacterium sp.]|uniref:rod shape-determining protein RodA n=1 Tax=Phascolarctobacterium sp. TaxID=2049039 RepID=UPI0026DAEF30|nr:rod shape-determining protein RodA [Phascolarctobacterium sp.]MDO4922368.1 rod shape-determining protein RodA [Phascolarctobacterium sp.]